MRNFLVSTVALALFLMVSFATVNSTYSATLWYNGDWDSYFDFPVIDTGTDAMIYDDFNVASPGWRIDTIWANYSMNFGAIDIFWEFRSGVSAGNCGTVLANAVTSPSYVVTQTLVWDRPTTDLDRYSIEITGLDIVLSPGTYWLSITPISPSNGGERAFLEATGGNNAIGTPPGNNANSFIDGTYSDTAYNFAAIQTIEPAFEDPDFSMGVGGSPVPEPSTMLLLFSGLIGLAAFWKKFKK